MCIRDRSIGALFHVVNDLERVGDHSENICELAQIVIDGKANPSYLAVSEIKEMQSMVTGILEEAIYMYSTRSTDKQLAQNINKTEDEIDERTRQLKDNHSERLNHCLLYTSRPVGKPGAGHLSRQSGGRQGAFL